MTFGQYTDGCRRILLSCKYIAIYTQRVYCVSHFADAHKINKRTQYFATANWPATFVCTRVVTLPHPFPHSEQSEDTFLTNLSYKNWRFWDGSIKLSCCRNARLRDQALCRPSGVRGRRLPGEEQRHSHGRAGTAWPYISLCLFVMSDKQASNILSFGDVCVSLTV